MLITKLRSVSEGLFPGAAYNEKKVEAGVAELAGAANVDGNFLHVLSTLHRIGANAAHEVEQYLQQHSDTFGNSKSTHWQFHYALSVKGREKSKEQLVEIAHEVMKEFGAEHNPYFIYFHRDTGNNHVHILGTRVKPNGMMLSDHQDFRRLNACLNRVVQQEQFNDVKEMLGYSFQTEGQLMNIIREFGYTIGENKEEPTNVVFYHGGAEAFQANLNNLIAQHGVSKMDSKKMERREEVARQLKAIFIKYREQSLKQAMPNGTKVKAKTKGKAKNKKDLMDSDWKLDKDIAKLTSSEGRFLNEQEQYQMKWFLQQLRSKFGVNVIFQTDRNGIIRGYGIVDHQHKMALNGSDVMKLSEIVNLTEWKKMQEAKAARAETKRKAEEAKRKAEAEAKRKAQEAKARCKAEAAGQRDTDAKRHSVKASPRTAQKPNRAAKPKVEIYTHSSYHHSEMLDIYRSLFSAKIGCLNGTNIVRMTLDGKDYDHAITDKQASWYLSTDNEEMHDDIALQIAVYFFHREIYEEYRRHLVAEYIKHGEPMRKIPYEHVRLYKKKNGYWELGIDIGRITAKYTLTVEEGKKCNFASSDPDALNDLRLKLVKEKVLAEEVEAISSHYKYEKVSIRPDSNKNGMVGTMNFASRHRQLMQRLSSVLSVSSSMSANREFEVGNNLSWSDVDDERRFHRGMYR